MKLPVPKLPKLTSLSSVIVTQAYRAQSITTAIQDAASLQYAEGVSRVELLSPAEIPKNWLALTSVDIICISLTDIEVMQNTTPAAWSAVDRWVRAGGVLWITGVGSNHKQLASLLKLADSEAFPYGWSMPPPRKRNFVAGSVSELAGIKTNVYRSRRDSRLITRSPVRRGKKTGPKKKKRTVRRPARRRQPSIFHRRLGLGTVLAFGSERPFRGKVEAIVALNTLGGRSWMWYQRHGMSMHRHNSGFWNFLISGVGEAPVASFLILISLFAVVIGPLNYASLRRGGRQFLMLITVPSGAALVTAFLVVYATFGDGFGVKVRTRSVIHIDQRTGQSTTWSRQNYYASMAPSRGLVFPSDSAVYHIQYSPKRNNKPPFRRTDWSSGDQRLSGGFMTSRDWCQLLVIRNRETTAGLAITDNGTKPPTVLNQLGTKVVTLVLVDESGNIYTSENIGINEPAQLQATTLKDVNKMLLDISTSNMMGVNRSALRRAESMARRQHYSQIIDRDAPAVRTGNSLLERSIVESLESFNPQPKTYLALVEDSTEVPLGTKAKRYESFEMVIGRW